MRLLFALALTFAACNTPPPEPPPPGALDIGDEVLLTIDEHAVTEKMVATALSPAPPEVRDQVRESPQEMQKLLDNMALTELLYHRALERKLHERPEVRDSMALAQREILGSFLMKEMADEKVTDAAVKERYDSLGARLNRPQADIDHILVERQDLANQLIADINAGKMDFLEAAKKHSIERGVEQHGGKIGWSVRAPIQELQEAWESAPVGEVVGPVEGRLGYHILRVNGRRSSVPLEEVEDKIKDQIRKEALTDLRKELMTEANIVDKRDGDAPAEGDGAGAEAGGAPQPAEGGP